MSIAEADPGSYRDIAGRVYRVGDCVFRTVNDVAADDFDFLRLSGLLDALVRDGRAVSAEEAEPSELGDLANGARYVVRHPCLPFISYPYEWSLAALKAAALLHLDIHLEALERGLTLSDASGYNIQFVGARPTFIDTLSFRRYRDGEFWEGYRQFCEQFLNPLLLRALVGLPHNGWYRGNLEGIPSGDLKRLIPLRRRFSWNVFTHVILHAALGSSNAARPQLQRKDIEARRLPAASFKNLLRGLRKWIARLQPADRGATLWRDYEAFKAYAPAETGDKKAFVARFAETVRPAMLWDIGCNTGEFSLTALEAGAGYAVGWDTDQNALDIAFRRAADSGAAFTPLYGDAANPAPSQGWAQAERPGWLDRGPADAVLALAVVHHLAISRNVPLPAVVDWLVRLAPTGVVEFADKDDPQVRRMLSLRKDIFPDYGLESFLAAVKTRAWVVETQTLNPSGRTLVWFDATEAR
jgi:ribosomal protein L11 methylase PrmA